MSALNELPFTQQAHSAMGARVSRMMKGKNKLLRREFAETKDSVVI